MAKQASQPLESKKQYQGQKPALALVRWLNDSKSNAKLVEALLLDAQVVFRWTAQFKNVRELNQARKKGKLPEEFWHRHRRLNQRLGAFTFAPHIDLHDFPHGERVGWTFVSPQRSSVALFSLQIRMLLQVIAQGEVLRVRRCKQCSNWYFAHFPNQDFCSTKCRVKHQSQSPGFKAHRRKYMQKYYALQKKKNVK